MIKNFFFVFSFYVALLLGCTSANVQQKMGINLKPKKGNILYLAHQYSFEDDLVHLFPNISNTNTSAGLVINTSLSLKLSDPLMGSFELSSLDTLFNQYPYLMPVFLCYLDPTQLQPISEGIFDSTLQQFAQYLKKLQRPVYLTIGVEVNSPVYRMEAALYQAAYRYVVEQMQQQGVNNVAYIWYVNGMNPSYLNKDILEWYPGDEYVNWIGTSLYKLTAEHYVERAIFTTSNHERIVAIAKQKKLPLMVVESSAIAVKKNLNQAQLWTSYYEPFFDFIQGNNQVQAFAHLYKDWQDDILTKKWLERLTNSKLIYSNESLFQQVGFDELKK